MEKEFVPMDLSVKLKELGFDKPCLAMYFTDKFAVKLQGSNKAFEFVVNSEMSKTLCAAPLWQQAFDWFRIIKRIDGLITFDNDPEDEGLDYHYGYHIRNWNSGKEICNAGWIKNELWNNYYDARTSLLEKLIELTLTHPSE